MRETARPSYRQAAWKDTLDRRPVEFAVIRLTTRDHKGEHAFAAAGIKPGLVDTVRASER